MSVGTHHHRLNKATLAKLNALRNTPSFRRMWARPFKVDVTRQIADTAGYNVLGTVYYLDKDFYAAVMSEQIKIPGMNPKQIIQAILIHERTEKCLLDADNDVNDYLGDSEEAGAHEYATLAEHEFVRSIGVTPRVYEGRREVPGEGLRKIIQYNEHKPLTIPPKDLDCEPHVDEMDSADKRALGEMRKLGVVDASKVSKASLDYSRSKGEDRCVRCTSWMGQPTSELAPCRIVSGAVRTEWWCKKYQLAEQPSAAPQPQESPPAVPQVAAPPVALAAGTPAPQQAPAAAPQQQDPAVLQEILKQHADALGKIAEAVKPAKTKKRRKKSVKLRRDEDGNLVADVDYGE
jgi:hypothetical protein